MIPALTAYVIVTVATRLTELAISRRNLQRTRTAATREYGRAHFPLYVALHVLLPFGLIAEVVLLGAQPPAYWPWLLVVFLAAQALRVWCIRALGSCWNVRVWVTPGMPIVVTGPYRWMRHPNYLAVVVELVAGPLLFGAWRTAAIASIVNAIALTLRIRAENAALARVASSPPD